MGVGRKQIIPGAGCSLHWIELLLRPDNPVFSTGGELAAFLHLVHATHQTFQLEHLVSLVSPVQVAAPGFILPRERESGLVQKIILPCHMQL